MAVLVETHSEAEGVTSVTLDRPERRNALDRAHLVDLRAALADAVEAQVRAVVVSGAGSNFCAGADLSTVEDDGFVDELRGLLEDLRRAPFAVIAAVHGPALGAGTQLAMACDLRVATRDATFGIPAAKLGLTVDAFTVHHLSRAVGHSIARAMLVGTEVFGAPALAESGFVHRLVDDDVDVRSLGVEWAVSIAALAPLTIAAHKAMLSDAEALRAPSNASIAARAAAWNSADLGEGLAAFTDRRRPQFKGR
ncbi:MAG: enoyl-CoA hydratase/isomerase family protein [Actinobacteria bacterium]|nr:enoyl-CoA hydratase/isomerase family protein [Actinomycetota bacterium]